MVIGGAVVIPETGIGDSKFAYTLVVDVTVEEGTVIILLTSVSFVSTVALGVDDTTSIGVLIESASWIVSFLKFRGSSLGSCVPSFCSSFTTLIAGGIEMSFTSFFKVNIQNYFSRLLRIHQF